MTKLSTTAINAWHPHGILFRVGYWTRVLVKRYYALRVAKHLQTEVRPCPICGNTSEFTLIHDHDRYGLPLKTQRCNRCQLLMEQPSPTDAFLDRFYSSTMYRGMYTGIPYAREGADNNFGKSKGPRYVLAVEKYTRMPDAATVLDFGSADGITLLQLKARHPEWKVYGLEPGANFSHLSRGKLDGLFSNEREIPGGLKFDLIMLWHVLEHLPHPDATLVHLREHLARNGRIVIEVPDERKYTGIADIHLGHLFHFNEDTISLLAKKAGLTVESSSHEDTMDITHGMRVILK
jgi:hypothetical protein